MVLTTMLLPPRLGLNKVNETDVQLISSRQVPFAALVRNVKAAVVRYVEEGSTCGIPRATGMVFDACVENHLSCELVGGEPAAAVVEKWLAESGVCHMGTHVGVHV